MEQGIEPKAVPVRVHGEEGRLVDSDESWEGSEACLKAMVSGTKEPDWKEKPGEVTKDGTIEWTNAGDVLESEPDLERDRR